MADFAPTARDTTQSAPAAAPDQETAATTKLPSPSFDRITLSKISAVLAGLCLVAALVSLAINPHQKQVQAENLERQQQLTDLQQALERYSAAHQGTYPSTNGEYWCENCTYDEYEAKGANDWIPGLVKDGYIDALPQDPANLRGTVCQPSANNSFAGYIYYSPAPPYNTDYKVIAQCTPPGYALNQGTAKPKSDYCSKRPPYDSSKLAANPFRDVALKPYVDPARYQYAYAIYTPGLACL